MITKVLYISAIFIVSCNFTYSYGTSRIQTLCPKILQETFKGYVPKGNLTAGTYTEVDGVTRLKSCFLKCCTTEKCNVAFMSNYKCYHISCKNNDLCTPTLHTDPETRDKVYMILVKPVDDSSWEDVLSAQDFLNKPVNSEIYNVPNREKLQDIYPELGDSSSYPYKCNIENEDSCMINEICIPTHRGSTTGTCECEENYFRNSDGDCMSRFDQQVSPSLLTEKIIDVTTNRSVPVTRKHLFITAESKTVKLPEDEVTLDATVEKTEDKVEDETYQYEWTSLHQPEESTAVKHQNGGQLLLSKLSEGLYTFKVSVSTTTSFGESFVNVTVLPATRINTPPHIIITPANQTIKQPNAAAVLDASSSTDDDGIVSYHWELQQGPLGYQPELKDNPTLQLNDLTKPGNYTFKLTVTDTDKATSTGLANITVLKFTDYPPEANAGEDKVIYLPQNKIILYGNLSSDDHNITTWEWVKSPDDAQKAVDMQDTRTPFLKLSNLEEGMYTFSLKVTDSAGQSSTAAVHVFVKPPTNKPPVAEAGPNITTSLPQTWVVLDGTNSTDDNRIVGFQWTQLEGPSTVNFENVNASKSNITGLTKGTYTFKLSVTDDNKNVATDLVYVIVNQNQNQKPTADAGPDFEIKLPRNVIFVNGTNSRDDWVITKWKWTRDDRSLALGKIAEKSDETPILIITDVAVGKYIFNLTVFDEQGLSDTDSVTIIVDNDPHMYHIVVITIDVDAKLLTEAQYKNLKGKLAILVPDGTKLQIEGVEPEKGTDRAKITFYVEGSDGQVMSANDIVHHLRQKLKIDAGLLSFPVAKLQTAVCQNNCSGHGVCIEETRKCECEAFWLQDLFKLYFRSDEDSDCSWSILYVVLGVLCSFLGLVGVLWGLIFLCCSLCKRRDAMTKPTTYKLIENSDDLPPFARKGALSDSDSDSDVVFESRGKPNRFNENVRNGHKSTRNGFFKGGRRVKT